MLEIYGNIITKQCVCVGIFQHGRSPEEPDSHTEWLVIRSIAMEGRSRTGSINDRVTTMVAEDLASPSTITFRSRL
jgi:hypothetical protein